jgi:hypothetical protein
MQNCRIQFAHVDCTWCEYVADVYQGTLVFCSRAPEHERWDISFGEYILYNCITTGYGRKSRTVCQYPVRHYRVQFTKLLKLYVRVHEYVLEYMYK